MEILVLQNYLEKYVCYPSYESSMFTSYLTYLSVEMKSNLIPNIRILELLFTERSYRLKISIDCFIITDRVPACRTIVETILADSK